MIAAILHNDCFRQIAVLRNGRSTGKDWPKADMPLCSDVSEKQTFVDRAGGQLHTILGYPALGILCERLDTSVFDSEPRFSIYVGAVTSALRHPAG